MFPLFEIYVKNIRPIHQLTGLYVMGIGLGWAPQNFHHIISNIPLVHNSIKL